MNTSEIFVEQSRLWIGTSEGMFVLEKGESKRIMDDGTNKGLIGDRVSSFLRDHQGILWVGTTKGLNSTSDEAASFIHYPAQKFNVEDFSITAMAEDYNGNLWIGTRRSGVLVLLKNRKESFWLGTKDLDAELLSNRIETIIISKTGDIWIGHSNGIEIFSPAFSKINLINTGSQPVTLKHDYVWSITESNNQVFWVTTPLGLHKLDMNDNAVKYFSEPIGG